MSTVIIGVRDDENYDAATYNLDNPADSARLSDYFKWRDTDLIEEFDHFYAWRDGQFRLINFLTTRENAWEKDADYGSYRVKVVDDESGELLHVFHFSRDLRG